MLPCLVVVCVFKVLAVKAAGNLSCARYDVGDGILVDIRLFQDGRRCMRALQSLASDQFRLLGKRGLYDRALLFRRKLTSWDLRLEALGWIVDNDELSVMMPSRHIGKLCHLVAE